MSSIRSFVASHPAHDPALQQTEHAASHAAGAERAPADLSHFVDEGVASRAAADTFEIVAELTRNAASTMADAGEISSRSLGAVRNTLTTVAIPLSATDHYFNDVRVASSDGLHGAASLTKAVADAAAGTVGGIWNIGAGVVADSITFVAPDSTVAEVVGIAADAVDPSAWLSGGAGALVDSAVVMTEGLLAADSGHDAAFAASSRAADRLDTAARDGQYGVAGRLAPAASDAAARALMPSAP